MDQSTITTIGSLGLTAIAIITAFIALVKSHNNVSDIATAAHETLQALLNNPSIVAVLKAQGAALPSDVKLLEGDLQTLLNLINTPNTTTTITTNAVGAKTISQAGAATLPLIGSA